MSFKHTHEDYLNGAKLFDHTAAEHKRGPVHRGKNTEGGTGSPAGRVPTTGNDGEVVRKARGGSEQKGGKGPTGGRSPSHGLRGGPLVKGPGPMPKYGKR